MLSRLNGVLWPEKPKTNFSIRKEAFTLNKIKALQNKQKTGCRPSDLELKHTGGGLVLTFSAAYYEALRHLLGQSSYTIHRKDLDESGEAEVREVIKVVNKAGSKLYTINLFPSKSRALVNGSAKYLNEQFLRKDLPYLIKLINEALVKMAISTEELNKSIVASIDSCLSQMKASQTCTPGGNPEKQNHQTDIMHLPGRSGDISCNTLSGIPTEDSSNHEALEGPQNVEIEEINENDDDIDNDDPNLTFESATESTSTQINDSTQCQVETVDPEITGDSTEIKMPCTSESQSIQTETSTTISQSIQTEKCTIEAQFTQTEKHTTTSQSVQTDICMKDMDQDTSTDEKQQSKTEVKTSDKSDSNIKNQGKNKSQQGNHCLSKGCKYNRREKKGEDMIMCGACFKWYHYSCTVDSREILESCVVYTCQDCRLLAAKVDDLLQHMDTVTKQLKEMSKLPSTAQTFLQKCNTLDTSLKSYKQNLIDIASNVSNVHDTLDEIADQQNHTRADILEVSVQVESLAQGITDLKSSVKKIETNQKTLMPTYSEMTARRYSTTANDRTGHRNSQVRDSSMTRSKTEEETYAPRNRHTRHDESPGYSHRQQIDRQGYARYQRSHVHRERQGNNYRPQHSEAPRNRRSEPYYRSDRNQNYNSHEHSNRRKIYHHSNSQPHYNMNENYQKKCWNCGESGHMNKNCWYTTPIQCHYCLAYGHKSKNCTNC